MEVTILNSSFEKIYTLDNFESLIWTDRYNKYGDFEIYTYIDSSILSQLSIDSYLYLKEADTYMIIEDIQITTDSENGNRLIVTGRSLESILDRRIIWEQTLLSGSLEEGIRTLLLNNIISSSYSERNIPNFVFEYSNDSYIASLTLDAQFTGDNLYDSIETICVAYSLGFKVYLNENNQFVFTLYNGKDKSYNQILNPYVIFSPDFNNLSNSSYLNSKKSLKTTTLIGGEGEGSERITIELTNSDGGGSSLNRREIFTDARDISSITSEGTLPIEEYELMLQQRGEEILKKYIFIESFDGQIENNSSVYKYKQDYYLGDIVQIVNEYGMETRSRVTEIIQSQSSYGIRIYPTLSSV